MSNKPQRDARGRFLTKRTAPKHAKHYAFVLDSSGSMDGRETAVINAFNEQLDALAELDKQGEKITISLITLGAAPDGKVHTVFVGRAPSAAERLSNSTYRPYGGTPLYSAILRATNELDQMCVNPDDSFFVITITDGEENESPRGTEEKVRDAIKRGIANDRWSYVFLVPQRPCCAEGAKQRLVDDLGAVPGNVKEWESDTYQGTVAMGQTLRGTHSQVVRYMSSTGATSSNAMGYFSPNLSSVKTTDLKKELTDISKDCKVWTVDKESNIKDFVLSHNKAFFLGAGYYQLMKTEKVQKYKQVIIIEKGKTAVYAGAEAREVLGLPDADVKVTPGNHSKYDIFIQSTSHNRILPRGTKLVYRLDHTQDSKHTWMDPTKMKPATP